MTTWHTRLTQAREEKGLDKSELARRVGVSAPTVTDWESGKIKKIDADNMLNVCIELGINPIWLMRGRGPTHAPPQIPSDVQDVAEALAQMPPETRAAFVTIVKSRAA